MILCRTESRQYPLFFLNIGNMSIIHSYISHMRNVFLSDNCIAMAVIPVYENGGFLTRDGEMKRLGISGDIIEFKLII